VAIIVLIVAMLYFKAALAQKRLIPGTRLTNLNFDYDKLGGLNHAKDV
jgi:hypothetical protein